MSSQTYKKYVYPINPVLNNDLYIYILEGETREIKYESINAPLNVSYKITTKKDDTIENINYIYNELNYIKRKSRRIIYNFGEKFIDFYNNLSYLQLDQILVNLTKHGMHNYNNINVMKFIKTDATYDAYNIDSLDYITKKYKTNITITDVTLPNYNCKYDYDLFVINIATTCKMIYNDKPIFYYYSHILLNIIKNTKKGISICICTMIDSALVIDLINLVSGYFEFTYIYKFKHNTRLSLDIMFINKKISDKKSINSILNLLKKNDNITRLYDINYDIKYSNFLKKNMNEYLNIFSIYTTILNLKLDEQYNGSLLQKNIDHYRNYYKYLTTSSTQ